MKKIHERMIILIKIDSLDFDNFFSEQFERPVHGTHINSTHPLYFFKACRLCSFSYIHALLTILKSAIFSLFFD